MQSFLTEEEWDYLFPESLDLYTYEAFLQAVGEFPKFCGEGFMDADDTLLTSCKREISTVLAHVIRETGHNEYERDYPQWRQGLMYITEIACTPPDGKPECNYKTEDSDWRTDAWPPVENVQYYGRGPFQLSWNFNYG